MFYVLSTLNRLADFCRMADDKELKFLFIKEALWQHADYLDDILQEAISRRKLINEGDLVDNISFNVRQDGDKPVLQVNFPVHGRFIEIRFYKSRNRQKHESEVRRNLYNLQTRKKKNAQWYTRNVMGGLKRLISSIQTGLTREEIDRLKFILEQKSA